MRTTDLGSSHALVTDSQLVDHPFSRCDRDLVERAITVSKETVQLVFPALKPGCARVVCLQSFPVLHGSVHVGERRVANAAAELMLHCNRQPLSLTRRLDLIAILNAVLAELDRVKVDEYISRHYFVHIRRPGKILRLVNRNLHEVCCLTAANSLTCASRRSATNSASLSRMRAWTGRQMCRARRFSD